MKQVAVKLMKMFCKLKINYNKLETSTNVCEKLETNTSHLMFEFPARRHFGSYFVIWLPLLLSNNGYFVQRFLKGMVEIIVATMKRHNIQNGGTQKIQISK